MDVAVAILYSKHSNNNNNSLSIIDRSTTTMISDFEILLEENSAAGGIFVPFDDHDSSMIDNDSGGIFYHRATTSANQTFSKIIPPAEQQKTATAVTTNKLNRQLPRKAISFDQEPSEIAATLACRLFSKTSQDKNQNGKSSSSSLFRRAVPVALWKSEPTTPYSGNILSAGENENSSTTTTTQNEKLIASGLSAALFCVPILEKEKITCKCPQQADNENNTTNTSAVCNCRYRFHPLDKVLAMCRNASSVIDPETRHLILRLDEWLKLRSKQQTNFLWNLFLRRPSAARFRSCVHNPGHKEELRSCHQGQSLLSLNNNNNHQQKQQQQQQRRYISGNHNNYHHHHGGAEIAEDVRSANTALACMMAIEKCDRLVMNSLFGSSLPYRINSNSATPQQPQQQQLSPSQYQYVAKNRRSPSDPSLIGGRRSILDRSATGGGSSQNPEGGCIASDAGSFADEYPLHRAAQIVGQASALRHLLAQHYDANQLDQDYWAPIHYASWYGHLAAVQLLLNYAQNCQVNVRNKNGSTPLHFAAWCGHQYVVELLLSHPDIDPELKDKDGKTALNLCECVPKPEWQAIADLLRTMMKKRRLQLIPKIQIDLADGSNVMLCLSEGADTTADQLHKQMCEELQLTEECGKLFAIWICSESLQLQLKGDHKPMQHLEKWKSKLWQWSDIADSIDYEEKARLIFRRDARVGLQHEKKVKLTDTALSLLFHEAHQNFLGGLYPCSDHDIVMLAATVLQIIHGEYDSKKDKLFLSNDSSLAKILPSHKIDDKTTSFNWNQQIMSEHKHISSFRAQNSLPNLQYRYLSFCEKFRSYGSAFFTAVMFVDKPVKGALYVHAGVNDAGLHLINCETKLLYRTFEYANMAFTFQPDRPFIKFRGKDNSSMHEFTLKTKQACMIHTLLCRFANKNKSVHQHQRKPSSASSNLSDEKSGTVIIHR